MDAQRTNVDAVAGDVAVRTILTSLRNLIGQLTHDYAYLKARTEAHEADLRRLVDTQRTRIDALEHRNIESDLAAGGPPAGYVMNPDGYSASRVGQGG